MSTTNNFLKDKNAFIEETNNLISIVGDAKKVAQILDDVIFESINHHCSMKSCCDDALFYQFEVLRQLRDIFAKS